MEDVLDDNSSGYDQSSADEKTDLDEDEGEEEEEEEEEFCSPISASLVNKSPL